MWKNVYWKKYKTRNPKLIITAVRNFPNMNETLEENIAYYQVKELQKDPMFLDVVADFWWHNGNEFIPLYLMDDIPKLEKLQKLQPLGKGWFWCVGYRSQGNDRYPSHSYKWYKDHLEYMLSYRYTENDGYINHLFKSAIKEWIYENSPGSTEEFRHRRFHLIENKNLAVDIYKFQKQDYLDYLTHMEVTNWYEFIFHAFK